MADSIFRNKSMQNIDAMQKNPEPSVFYFWNSELVNKFEIQYTQHIVNWKRFNHVFLFILTDMSRCSLSSTTLAQTWRS